MRTLHFAKVTMVLVGAAAILGTTVGAEPESSAHAAAIAAMQRLGARMTYQQERLSISFHDVAITDVDLKYLRALPELTSLELRDTPVTDAGLSHLQGLRNLEHLGLYDTAVSDVGLEHLRDLKKLRFLMLKRTNATIVGAQRLQRILPECLISHSPRTHVLEMPTGKWNVVFANGVQQACAVQSDGATSVVEPKRTSAGQATVEGSSIMAVFADDRIERWTPVGQRMVVEHWFPGSQYPLAQPVRGIADRAP